jgi:hypothetical protein
MQIPSYKRNSASKKVLVFSISLPIICGTLEKQVLLSIHILLPYYR